MLKYNQTGEVESKKHPKAKRQHKNKQNTTKWEHHKASQSQSRQLNTREEGEVDPPQRK